MLVAGLATVAGLSNAGRCLYCDSVMFATPKPETTRRAAALPWLAFVGCCAIWGSTFLVIRIGNDSLPPLWAASVRLMLAVVLLTALASRTAGGLPRGAALRSAMVFGMLAFGFGFCLLYWGEQGAPSGLSAVMYGLVPVTTALIASALGLERLKLLKLLAALVALAGVATLFSGQLHTTAPPVRLGAVMVAALLGALAGVLLKRGPRQNPLGLNAVAAMTGLVICLTASFVFREPHPLPRTAAQLLPIVYLAVAGSIGAFVLYTWLVSQWKVSRASFIAVVVPVVALILGSLVRHETLGATGALGAGLVLAGLALTIAADRLTR